MGHRKPDWQYGNHQDLPERPKPIKSKPRTPKKITIERADGSIEVIK